jgi:hypothetical protein
VASFLSRFVDVKAVLMRVYQHLQAMTPELRAVVEEDRAGYEGRMVS